MHVGTLGKETSDFVANEWGGVKEGLSPVAELEFSNLIFGGLPIRVRTVLSGHSCADGFMGVFDFPKNAAEGSGKLTLSFPNWKDSWATDEMLASKVVPSITNIRISRAELESRP